MAFFPLVLDTSNGNQIKEIPAASELSLSGVQLIDLANLSISGSFGADNATIAGSANIGGDTTIGGSASVAGDFSAFTLTLDSELTSTGNISTTESISASSGLSTSGNFSVFGSSSLQTTTMTDATVSGTLTLGAVNVADYLVQSDWAVNNPSNPAFIKNKPDLNVAVPEVINDLNDVNAVVGSPAFADNTKPILAWDGGGGVWVAMNQPAPGVTLTDFSTTDPTAPPGSTFDGNIVYNSTTGEFTFEQPDIPRTLADLGVTNNVTADNFAETAFPLRIFQSTGINNTDGLIGISVTQDDAVGDTVTLSINNPGWITGESDTLQSVTDRGAVTTQDITTGAINASSIDAQATELAPNNIGFSAGSSLSLTGALDVTGNSTFGASIDILSAVGEIQATTLTTSDRLNSDLINSSTELLLRGTKVTVDGNHFKITPNVTLPSSPTVGDITHNGDSAAIYVTDKDSGGNPGWVWLGGPFAPEGIILPNKTNTERNAMTPVLGMMILNIDSGTVQVYNGSAWINVGP